LYNSFKFSSAKYRDDGAKIPQTMMFKHQRISGGDGYKAISIVDFSINLLDHNQPENKMEKGQTRVARLQRQGLSQVEFQLGVVGVDGSKFGDRLSQPTND
jgi:hypothetical protein